MRSPDQSFVHTLPLLRLTRLKVDGEDEGVPVDDTHNGIRVRYERHALAPIAKRWTEFRSIPLVVDSLGKPWAEACLWLLERAQLKPQNIESLRPIATDLAAYKTFLDELAIDWDDFSSVEKYAHPTYLFHQNLLIKIQNGELARSTSSRRMSNVIRFYRYVLRENRMRFKPKNNPWIESQLFISFLDDKGFKHSKAVTTTDISISKPKTDSEISEEILDSGKLRPLSINEQKILIKALKNLKNTEYTLMHYIALLTGAREMSVLTLRIKHFSISPDQIKQWPHKIRCGPGTGIDTKRNVSDKNLVIPRELYELLHAYAVSGRAIKRRAKTTRGEDLSNYLFLTQHGQPYFESKEDRNTAVNANTRLRHSSLSGRPLRKYIEQKVIIEIRKIIKSESEFREINENFSYRFHDLRASFGMNWVDYRMQDSSPHAQNEKYPLVREELRSLMWHENANTTDRYLQYRSNSKRMQNSTTGWNKHLIELISEAKYE